MFRQLLRYLMVATLAITVLAGGSGVAHAFLSKDGTTPYVIGPGDPYPDYLTTPNWANSPVLRKFVDPLPLLCDPATTNCNLTNDIPLAVPDIVTYPGSDYYVIELRQFTQQMHSDLAPTTLRGYKQANAGTDTAACTDPALGQANPCTAASNTIAPPTQPKYLGPLIIAQKDRPVRILFRNLLPTGAGGKLFVPVDGTVMGAGPFAIDYNPTTGAAAPLNTGEFAQNRADLHLHGGRSPWISDGTPHQWITPNGEPTTYPRGVSVENVPDMPAPGPGEQTYYYTNQQSARLMFYHDHAWGITRLNVYAGEAAGYLITDATEQSLINTDVLPVEQIPLVIQDKTFVDTDPASPFYVYKTDPTWNWGMTPGTAHAGDLWWPHVYMPAQNPFDVTGIAPMGRWAYGPYFWPATNNPFQPIPNPYYNPLCDVTDPAQNETNTAGYTTIPVPGGGSTPYCQPPEIPSTPNPSWGAEAFMDTPVVNGVAYPVLEVEPKAYRLRILNAAHDRFFNLSMFKADPAVDPNTPTVDDPATPNNEAALTTASAALCATFPGGCATATEIRMLPAIDTVGMPATWPVDGRVGGFPDWTLAGPEWTMIGTEGGFLPQPVVIPPNPVSWNLDVTTFNAGNVNGGSLMLGPAERADVIVDFANFAGQTLILYNDAPAPWPALDPHYDYFTGAPDMTEAGGAPPTLPGVGPNTRTIMQIKVVKPLTAETKNNLAYDPAKLTAAFDPAPTDPALSVFEQGQDPIIVGQTAYNTTYDTTFPGSWPNWGLSRINDKQISFKTLNADGSVNQTPLTVGMKFKAIQDEQGETFDDYGRMRAALGLELANAGAGQVNFIVQTFSDPSTEVVNPNEIQIWKITHNGVDTHPVHFHLFDVQVINRVGWDGFIRLPDPTELGWKDTVRISPLEDTIVALKPATPKVPFGLPESKRPLNPATVLGSTVELSAVDPNTGNAWATPNVNRILNFDWEYVWHCHILSHEENDMMRPVVFKFAEQLPGVPILNSATVSSTTSGSYVVLKWTDPTPASNPATLGNPANEINFIVEKSVDGGATYAKVKGVLANTTTANVPLGGSGDYYRIKANNAKGSTVSNAIRVNVMGAASPAPSLTVPLNVNSRGRATVTATASPTPGALYNYQYRLVGAPSWTKGAMNQTSLSVTIILPAPGTYEFQVYVTAPGGFTASTPTAGSNVCTVSNVIVAPASLTVPATTATANVQTVAAATLTPGTFNYRFQYSANAGAAWTTYYDGPLLNPTATLPAQGTYIFRVQTYDPAVPAVYTPSAWRAGSNATTW